MLKKLLKVNLMKRECGIVFSHSQEFHRIISVPSGRQREPVWFWTPVSDRKELVCLQPSRWWRTAAAECSCPLPLRPRRLSSVSHRTASYLSALGWLVPMNSQRISHHIRSRPSMNSQVSCICPSRGVESRATPQLKPISPRLNIFMETLCVPVGGKLQPIAQPPYLK